MKSPQEFTKEEKMTLTAFMQNTPMALQMVRSLDPMSFNNFLYYSFPFFRSQRQNDLIWKSQKRIGVGILGSLLGSTALSILSTPYIIKLSGWARFPIRTLIFLVPLGITKYYVLDQAYDDLVKTHMNISRRVMRLGRSGKVEDFFA